jgi:5-oxoprolinase (ATP-hydrolysing) subunit A
MEMYSVDINCDLGEGFPDDERIMPFISSANIACGAHAGNESVMSHTIQLALQYGVKIGAHPGFNDPENFGRKNHSLSDAALTDLIQTQVFQLQQMALHLGAKLHHVKPHGALYNMSACSQHIASVIALAVKEVDSSLCLYGLSNSYSIKEAQAAGLLFCNEVFADRRYQSDGTLVARTNPHALLANREESVNQVVQMVLQQTVIADNGAIIPVCAETICIHGDAPGAASLAADIFHHLQSNNIGLRKN